MARMPLSRAMIALILPLSLIGLIIPASIALYNIRSLALPISTVTATATVLLPIIISATTYLPRRIERDTEDEKPRITWSAILLTVLPIIYETAIATLALTHMVPPSNLDCGLERQWARLFSNKNAGVIRRIQDRHQCCGLNSVRDRAWPFPDRSHTAAACHEAFERQHRCLDGWRQDEQVAGGLMLLVAIVACVLQALMVYQHWRNDLGRSAIDQEIPRGGSQRRLRDVYRDDPLVPGVTAASLPDIEDNRADFESAAEEPRIEGDGDRWR